MPFPGGLKVLFEHFHTKLPSNMDTLQIDEDFYDDEMAE